MGSTQITIIYNWGMDTESHSEPFTISSYRLANEWLKRNGYSYHDADIWSHSNGRQAAEVTAYC